MTSPISRIKSILAQMAERRENADWVVYSKDKFQAASRTEHEKLEKALAVAVEALDEYIDYDIADNPKSIIAIEKIAKILEGK